MNTSNTSATNAEILFSERQAFWKNRFCMGTLGVLFGVGVAGTVAFETAAAVFPSVAGAALLAWTLFLWIRLDTKIQSDGVYYRLFPLNIRMRKKLWNEIAEAYTCRYRPLRDFGGWGIRMDFFGKGWAWNVAGDKGLQLILTNGKKILIGTQKPEEIDAVLARLGFHKKP